MNEQEKYSHVWEHCARYGKEWTRIRHGSRVKNWFLKHARKPATVMDFGVGNGTSLLWMEHNGFEGYGIDIATNCTDHPNVVFDDLRNPNLELKVCDYGFCTDVMEHMPTPDVDQALENIAKHINKGCLFVIARDEDKDGGPLGLELHLTRKPKEWWDEKLLKYFKNVRLLAYDVHKNPDAAYVCWAVK